MIRALWTAASGMTAQQLNNDVIANNLANVNTTGFKRSRADFQDLLYQTIMPAGTSNASGSQIPVGIQVGHGTRPIAIQKMFAQGDYQETGNPLDLVIEGDGFFQVITPDGNIAYTRAGAFKRDSQGQIVTSDGFVMKDQITIPQDSVDIAITSDGAVQVSLPGQSEPQQLGVIELARFTNPAGLSNIGKNLYMPTASSGQPIIGIPGMNGFGSIGQRSLEMSNVKVVEEMVNLIVAQRAYEINSKAIQTADEMLGIANNLRR
ncbi:MAG: flagellar basal-body rod protein FlgG [Euryarchaeota archaeon]|nr:flagellar basal-body rod protein FlgG [Candidatus Gottesmanbacteria bacterium]MBM4242011.1 flagellar basal-body rod protein FlgG [Euryarchaeota archaeon]